MPRNLNSAHLLLKAAWTAAHRGDIIIRQEPPATYSCLLALALCLLGKLRWGHRVPAAKVTEAGGCKYQAYQQPCFAISLSALSVWAKSSHCQRICNRSSQQGSVPLSPSQAILKVCKLLGQETEIGEAERDKPSSTSPCFSPAALNQTEAK